MEPSQSQVGADSLFLLFSDVEAKKNLAVAVRRQFHYHLPHEGALLFQQQLVELVWRGVRQRRNLFDLRQAFLPSAAAEMVYHQIAGNATHEAGEFLGLAQVSSPNLLQRDAKCLLAEIIYYARATQVTTDDEHHAAPVPLDQLDFSLLIASHDAADQINSMMYITRGANGHS